MWRKKRHSVTFFVLRPFLKIYLKMKYNYKPQKYKGKEKLLILSNHTATFDFFFVAVAFRKPIYFLASDDLFNRGFLSSVLKYLVAPIPKNKSIKDSQAVRGCLQVSKEGGTISVFPEGNRSLSGDLSHIDISIVKLCKKLKHTLVIYAIEGGYQSDARYSVKNRRGKMRGIVKKVIKPDELEKLSDEELYNIIIEGLSVNLITDKKFSTNVRAEGLQRAIYYCKDCDSIGHMTSHKNDFKCTKCNSTYFMNRYCFLTKGDETYSVSDLNKIQLKKVRSLSMEETSNLNYTDEIELFEVDVNERKLIYTGEMNLSNNILKFGDMTISFDEIESVSIILKNKMNIFVGDKRLQTKGINLFCAIKYMHAFYHYKNLKNGTNDINNEFLGL